MSLVNKFKTWACINNFKIWILYWNVCGS